jgi:REP element-mobilizing transposase RayT
MPPLLPRWLAAGGSETRGLTFFVTWRVHHTDRILSPPERDLVCRTLKHGDGGRYCLRAYVVMDDHVHVLVTVMHIPIERLVHSWKSFTAHELQRLFRRTGGVWQPDEVRVPLVGEEALRHKAEYIVGNPWKRWPFLKHYPWVWEGDGPADRSKA